MRCFIVLPCFNEEKNIEPLVHSIDEALRHNVSYKIIAVNDGSYDRTGDVLKTLSVKYPLKVVEHSTNLGLGTALRTGLSVAAEEALDDDVVVTMDSDNTHDPKSILDMLIAARKSDIVVGSRYIKGGAQLNVPAHRVILSRLINTFAARLFKLHVKDITSSFRCFRGAVIKKLYSTSEGKIIHSNGFESSLELLFRAVHFGVFVSEVPILLDYSKKNGASKMRVFSTILNYLFLFLKFKQIINMHRPKL